MTWILVANTMLAQRATRASAIPMTARYARMLITLIYRGYRGESAIRHDGRRREDARPEAARVQEFLLS